MTARRIVSRLLLTVALLGIPLLAIRSFADLDGRGSISGLRLARAVGAGVNGSSEEPSPGAGSAKGPEGGSASGTGPAAASGRPDEQLGTSRGDTSAPGRESHSGTSGVERPAPTATP